MHGTGPAPKADDHQEPSKAPRHLVLISVRLALRFDLLSKMIFLREAQVSGSFCLTRHNLRCNADRAEVWLSG